MAKGKFLQIRIDDDSRFMLNRLISVYRMNQSEILRNLIHREYHTIKKGNDNGETYEDESPETSHKT
jgi:hypothetical protein